MKKASVGMMLALGVAIGTAIGVATDDLAVWVALGAAFGVVLASAAGASFRNTCGRDDG